jgi:hypothetical protein
MLEALGGAQDVVIPNQTQYRRQKSNGTFRLGNRIKNRAKSSIEMVQNKSSKAQRESANQALQPVTSAQRAVAAFPT